MCSNSLKSHDRATVAVPMPAVVVVENKKPFKKPFKTGGQSARCLFQTYSSSKIDSTPNRSNFLGVQHLLRSPPINIFQNKCYDLVCWSDTIYKHLTGANSREPECGGPYIVSLLALSRIGGVTTIENGT